MSKKLNMREEKQRDELKRQLAVLLKKSPPDPKDDERINDIREYLKFYE